MSDISFFKQSSVIIYFSLFYIVVNRIFLGFGLLVSQSKQFEDALWLVKKFDGRFSLFYGLRDELRLDYQHRSPLVRFNVSSTFFKA